MFLEDSAQSTSQRNQILCSRSNDMIYRSDAQLSKASSVQTTRTFRPDLPLCREASNCSSLHPSRRFSSTSGCHSMFDQLWDFFPKHKYGKTTITVRTMWIPVWTPSSIRQVAHSKIRRPDNGLHGPDARALFMEIACIKFTSRKTNAMVQTRQALIWKLRAAKVRPSGRHGNTVQMRLNSRKNICEILESRSHSCPFGRLMSIVWTTPRYFKPNAHLNL
jgi:hypothetical protein